VIRGLGGWDWTLAIDLRTSFKGVDFG